MYCSVRIDCSLATWCKALAQTSVDGTRNPDPKQWEAQHVSGGTHSAYTFEINLPKDLLGSKPKREVI